MKQGAGNISRQKLHKQKAPQPQYSYHQMPLNIFIDQVESGTIDQGIYDQFVYAIKDTEEIYFEKLTKELNILTTKYECVQTAVKALEFGHDAQIWAILQQVLPGIRDTDTLQIILNRSQLLVQQMELKKAELERIRPVAEFQTADRKYFIHLMIQVELFKKAQLDKFKITVQEFAENIVWMRETNQQVALELKKAHAGK